MSKEKNKEFLEHLVEHETEPQITEPVAADPVVVDRKRNWALLRYIAIMFAVAFILVFMSLYFTTRHDSQQTISQLSQNANSALARAEQLQTDNRELTETNMTLQESLTLAENDLQDAENTITTQEGIIAGQAEDIAKMTKEMETLTEDKENLQKAYALLAQAQLAYEEKNWESCAKAIANLESLQDYLDKDSKTIYNRLCTALETNKEN
ncbi:MAG: hypothetical protein E7459_08100 [Ruminococcaceae bacterium]|nr:hypothetical protein [Oscillospiraceae bacterium]